MSVLPGPSKLDLIPWDYNSEEHRHRAYLQRIACGWRFGEVPDWVEKCKEGKMMVYWLVLSESVPDRDAQVATHIEKYPKETSPLKDTATESWKGHPRTPTNQPIHPIGHVGLIIPPESELKHLSLPLTGVAYIGKLYVSYALQSYGYGGVTMRAVEAISRDQLGADMCILDTILHEYQMRPDVMERFYVQHGNPLPKISNEHWYAKMGYVSFKKDDKGYLHTHVDTGEKEYLPVSYFKKMLK
ncbi:hypothetical protein BR93DRAFT_70761 [Coniochaeta sp. PMI_546]|nr:hypothetical protein BR93DRAFT_70761 [Coniochaeta sp. PMI_546]